MSVKYGTVRVGYPTAYEDFTNARFNVGYGYDSFSSGKTSGETLILWNENQQIAAFRPGEWVSVRFVDDWVDTTVEDLKKEIEKLKQRFEMMTLFRDTWRDAYFRK